MLTNDTDSPNVHDIDRWRGKRIGRMAETANFSEGFTTTELPVYTPAMNDITREELSSNLTAIEDRMDRRIDRMERESERRSSEYRQELALRDDQLRRELDLRQESFRAEQSARDASLAEKFSGFLAAQAERDKAFEKIADSRFERIEKDVTSIKADTKKVGEDVNGIKVTMGKYLGGAIVIGAIASALLGVALKYAFSLAS